MARYPDGVKWLRMPRVVGVGVCLYLIVIGIAFTVLAQHRDRFLDPAVSSQGTVIRMEPVPYVGSARAPGTKGTRPAYAPVVRYSVGDKQYEYQPSHGTYRPRWRVGQQLTIIYDPSDPQGTARIRGEGKLLLPVIAGGFYACALAMGLVLFATRSIVQIDPGPASRVRPAAPPPAPGKAAHRRRPSVSQR